MDFHGLMVCNECEDAVKFYVRVNVAPWDFRPLCLPCAEHLGHAGGMVIRDSYRDGCCGRCGGNGAAGASGLCSDCVTLAETREATA